MSFSERFLSDRAYQLIVVPALADLQFDEEAGRRSRLADRLAVLRAVAGAIGDDVWRDWYSVFKLSLLVRDLLHVSDRAWHQGVQDLDRIPGRRDRWCLALAMVPVMVCFWPERRTAPPID